LKRFGQEDAMNKIPELVFQSAANVDFSTLLAGVRKLQPKCAQCGFPHAGVFGEYRARVRDDGNVEQICTACAVSEIGESLLKNLPQ
jgi:hypothetical protein